MSDASPADPGQPTGDALAVLLDVLRESARERPDVREALAALSELLRSIVREIEREQQQDEPAESAGATLPLKLGDALRHVRVVDSPESLSTRVPQPPREQPPPTPPAPAAPPLPDLRLIARRARLKAECCRWAITRRKRVAEDAPFETAIKPTDDDLLERARTLPRCRVWPLDPYVTLPDDETLEQIAAVYENLASAAELTQEIVAHDDPEADADFRPDAYALLAEAQSALRVQMERLALPRDTDQDETYHWLNRRTTEDRIYVPRFMRRADPADPAGWLDLQQRIEQLRQQREQLHRSLRERRNLLNKARYHARQLASGRSLNPAHDWQRIAESLDALVAGGIAPSNTELRDLLLPIFDDVPAELEESGPPGFVQILREIDRYLASQRRTTVVAQPPEPSDEVRRVAELLRGKVVVLIGGERQPEAVERLKRDFELAELRWISTTPHQRLDGFEPQVARPEVALVLLMIRWTSHSMGQIHEMCLKYGKPFVRLPGGYGTNQIAHRILEQVGRELQMTNDK